MVTMREGLNGLEGAVKESGTSILMNRTVDLELVREYKPDLVVWAPGALQNIPEIPGLNDQYTMTSLEFFRGEKDVQAGYTLAQSY